MTECPLCKRALATSEERQTQMCSQCAHSVGVIAMPAPRRISAPCRECNGLRFIRAIPRELSPKSGTGDQPVNSTPMSVTFDAKELGIFGGVFAPNPQLSYGMLEIYICKGCGHVEWYCIDPDRVPIGPHYMTEDVDYGMPSATPFR